jgi:hypothetical protein
MLNPPSLAGFVQGDDVHDRRVFHHEPMLAAGESACQLRANRPVRAVLELRRPDALLCRV